MISAEEPAVFGPRVEPRARAFRGLYEDCLEMVLRALARLGVSDPELDEAAADVFVAAYRRVWQHDPRRTGARAWVYSIARGVAANRRSCSGEASGSWSAWYRVPGPSSPMAGFIEGMRPDRRAVFELCEIEGLPTRDAARLLGIEEATLDERRRAAWAEFDAWTHTFDEGGPADRLRAYAEATAPGEVRRAAILQGIVARLAADADEERRFTAAPRVRGGRGWWWAVLVLVAMGSLLWWVRADAATATGRGASEPWAAPARTSLADPCMPRLRRCQAGLGNSGACGHDFVACVSEQ